LQQNQNNNNNLVVYVGDSSTDLLALIQADVGILLMGSKSTIGLALKFGVTIRSLNDYNNHNDDIDNSNNEFNNNNNISTTTTTSTKEEKENNGVDIIWTASDWDEIGSFLNHNDERLH
jgi:magnesium-transporting ATPase (P-type)